MNVEKKERMQIFLFSRLMQINKFLTCVLRLWDSTWHLFFSFAAMPSEEISLLNKIIHKKLENLQQGSVQISQLQSDPSSPLYSANTFESLRLYV